MTVAQTGTDEQKLDEILTGAQPEFMREVFNEFRKLGQEKEFEDVVKDETSGDYRMALLMLSK